MKTIKNIVFRDLANNILHIGFALFSPYCIEKLRRCFALPTFFALSRKKSPSPILHSLLISKFLIFFLACCFTLVAQNPDLPTGEVEVIKNFDALLLETEKLDVEPSLPALDTTTKRQTYFVPSKTITVDYLPPKIRPIAMKSGQKLKVYNGYAKLGAGFPASFYADASYDIFAQKQIDVGVDLKHHSANNTNKVDNQRFSHTSAGVDGTYYHKQGFAVNAGLRYGVNNEYAYGYNFDNPIPSDTVRLADDVRLRYSTFEAKAKVFNGEPTVGDFNYSAGADIYYFTDGDLDIGKETGFALTFNGTKWFNEKHPLSVTLITDFTNFRLVEKQTLNNFFLQPNFTYHADAFKVKIGTNIASHKDEFSFFPDVEVTANVIGSALAAFAGATGTLNKNNYRNLANYNPYIRSQIDIRNTKEYDFYGGVKGNVSGINYLAKVGYKNTNNLALFLSHPDTINRFNVLYDSVGIVYIGGTVSAIIAQNLEALGTIHFNNYNPSQQLRAWHLPAFDLNFGLKYKTLEDKLTVKAELFIENGVPYLDDDGLEQTLNGLFDISLGANYRFSENFGVFLDIYNLADNQRQRWYRYPTFGINVLGGITARF